MLLAALLWAAPPAAAFETATNADGVEVSWEVMPVWWTYDDTHRPHHLDRASVKEAVREAFAAWNAVPGARVTFLEADGDVPEDRVNPVGWEPDWPWAPDIVAMTSTWSRRDGTIEAFRVDLNARDPHWDTAGSRDAMDLQNTLAHEVGHALGLGHDPHHAEATMAPTAHAGETRKRSLHRSDEDGARHLYPGEGSPGLACSALGVAGTAWLPAALGAATLRRRRRRISTPTPTRRLPMSPFRPPRPRSRP